MKKSATLVTDEPIAHKNNDCSKPRVRDRIFDAATELFYRQGINNVGIDAIVCEAGSNKMSLYRNFSSKEDLVVEYLKQHSGDFFVEWDAISEAHPDDPRGEIEALFALKEKRGREKGMCGCPSAYAAVELRASEHPAMDVVYDGRRLVRKRLRKLVKAAGATSPEILADGLGMLLEGSVMSRVTFPENEWPGENLTKVVKMMLDAQLP